MGQIAVKWTGQDSKLFIGRDRFGHVVMTGSWPKDGNEEWTEWKALKPSDLLLLSLASCSGYDVVMISQQQRQTLTDLYVEVDAKQANEPPYHFTDIHMHYIARGEGLNAKKLERAITLSEEKYCSVAATIRGVAKITHSFEIKEP